MSAILVDMDGVLVDWGSAYGKALDTYGKDARNIPRHKDQRTFNLHEGLSKHEEYIVDRVMESLDYYTMEPLPDAASTLQGMLEYGHDVMICTSPWLPNESCIRDKLRWVQGNLGADWVERVIVTRDKTVIKGDWLIDDKPVITGRQVNPDWTHVVFDQPYNQEVTSQPRLMTWGDWDNRRFE